MDIKQLNEIITAGKIDKTKEIFELSYDLDIINKAIKQYNPELHDVRDPTVRRDKKLESGRSAPVTRISLPIQKKIVLTAVTMLGSPTLECTPKEGIETQLFDAVKQVGEDNKLDYQFKKIAKRVMSELHCAELWYLKGSEEGKKLKMRLLHYTYDPVSRTGGDSLYPVFDVYGDMIAFGRGYKIKANDKTTDYFEIYTAEKFYYFKREELGGWVSDDKEVDGVIINGAAGIKNPFGKIPVIFAQQEVPEWYDVQQAIDRLEKKISNHADTNDRFDSPILLTKGEFKGFALEKDDTGKLLEAVDQADASYLTWDNAPASMKIEIDNLLTFIHEFTHTPRLTFETLATKGIDLSGVALKMLFLDAHMKAADKEDIFGEYIQRRVNFLKSAICTLQSTLKGAINLPIKPKFTYFLPKNIPETVNIITTAVQGKVLSKKTGARLIAEALDINYNDEQLLLDEEAEAEAKSFGMNQLLDS